MPNSHNYQGKTVTSGLPHAPRKASFLSGNQQHPLIRQTKKDWATFARFFLEGVL